MNKQEATQLYRQANQLFIAKRFDEALLLLDQLAQAFPQHAEVKVGRAWCLAKLGRHEEAVQAAQFVRDTLKDPRGAKLLEQLTAVNKPEKKPRKRRGLQLIVGAIILLVAVAGGIYIFQPSNPPEVEQGNKPMPKVPEVRNAVIPEAEQGNKPMPKVPEVKNVAVPEETKQEAAVTAQVDEPDYERAKPIGIRPDIMAPPQFDYTEQDQAALDAAAGGHLEELKRLIADHPNLVNTCAKERAFRASPLCMAAEGGHLETVVYLLEQGAETNPAYKDYGWTPPLNRAAGGGHVEVVKALLEAGADPNSFAYNEGSTRPIHDATWGGHTGVIQLLLDAGVDVNSRNGGVGATPLMSAVSSGLTETASFLLSQGADASLCDAGGRTPLHSACRGFFAPPERETAESHVAMAQLLLNNGADPNAKDKDGKTPLDLARDNGLSEVVKLLESTASDSTPLFKAFGLRTFSSGRWVISCKLEDDTFGFAFTDDAGATWRTISGPNISKFLPSPHNPAHIIAGLGGQPLMLSKDDGATWTEILPDRVDVADKEGLQPMSAFWAMTNPDEILVSLLDGTLITKDLRTGETDVIAKLEDYLGRTLTIDGTLYSFLGAYDDYKCYSTNDDGRTWQKVPVEESPKALEASVFYDHMDTLLPERSDWARPYVKWLESFGSEDNLYCAISSLKEYECLSNAGIFVSQDGGASWSRIAPDSPRSDPERLFINSPFVVQDEEASESRLYIRDLAWDEEQQTILAIDDDGICYARKRPSGTWRRLDLISHTQPAPKAIDPKAVAEQAVTLPDNLFIGTIYDRSTTETDADWQRLCEAKGRITIPAGKETKFVHFGWVPEDGMRFVADAEFGDANVSHVASIPGLRELVLRKAELTDNAMQEIGRLGDLRRLDIAENEIGDEGLTQLGKLTQLEELNLANTQVTDSGIASVARITSLRSINLTRTQITDEALSLLGQMEDLESLRLGATQITDVGLTKLSGLTKLRELQLGGTSVTSNGTAAITGLTTLEVLGLAMTQIDDAGIASIGQLPHLLELSLNGTKITNACTSHLGNLQGLKILHLGGTQIDGEGLANLNGLDKLERLTLYPFTDDTLAYLAPFKHLKNLELAEAPITDAGLKHLEASTSLEIVDLSRTKISDASLGCLRNNTNLRELRLGWTGGITDQGVAHIAGFKSLECLVLAGTQVTDAGLKHVKELTNLRELSLWTTAVTDAGIAELAVLESLEKLQLPHTKITDAAVEHLSKMKSLRELTLPDRTISDEAVARLRKALPDCRID